MTNPKYSKPYVRNVRHILFSIFSGLYLTTSLTFASSASAHGMWFAPRVSQLAVVYGIGSQDLEIVKRMDDITYFQGYGKNWKKVETQPIAAGPLVIVDMENQPAAIAAVMDNGYWVKLEEDGNWIKKGKDEEPDAIRAEKAMKWAVHIVDPEAIPIPELPSQKLQIIPVSEGWPKLKGEKMKLRVLFNGKPATGAMVKADYVTDVDDEPEVVGADGIVTVEVQNQGVNVISAMHYGPTDDPKKAEKIEHTATLSFVLPQKSN